VTRAYHRQRRDGRVGDRHLLGADFLDLGLRRSLCDGDQTMEGGRE
jgi:hypothetical protein